MNDTVIRVEHLSKRYRIGKAQQRHDTLRDVLVAGLRAPLQRLRRNTRHETRNTKHETIWALKDVSFEVRRGEVVGIIGRNGAGKSTLLKLLSRITKPTEGRAVIDGRVGSLLEVGTGFHPELTGRENVYLNGAVLGMRKAEIEHKFDEIVAFAEIERFLDTPVKRYSSGMYVRLAFAVAAHLEPEILLVDEVLAVGDADFQKKCLGKMSDVATQGRTVLFVSHNMAAVEGLCSRCLLLDRGRLRSMGDPRTIIGQYLASGVISDKGQTDLSSHPGRISGSDPCMKEVALFSNGSGPISSLRMGAPLSVQVDFQNPSRPLSPVLGVVVKSILGVPILGVNNRFVGGYHFSEPVMSGTIVCNLKDLPLMPGKYFLDLYFGDQYRDHDVISEAISFEVLPADVFGTGKLPSTTVGTIFWPATWELGDGKNLRRSCCNCQGECNDQCE